MVAGPPVEVQVRVLDWSSNVKPDALGEPAWIEVSETGLWMCDQVAANNETCIVIICMYTRFTKQH